jgi:hypothetical protein
VKLTPIGVGAAGPEDDRSVEHAAVNSAAAMKKAKKHLRMTPSHAKAVPVSEVPESTIDVER